MATTETQVKKRIRCLRDCKIVLVRPLEDGENFLVTDMEGKNEYTINKETFEREYEEI